MPPAPATSPPANAYLQTRPPIAAPEKDYRSDVDAMLAKVTDKTRIVAPHGQCDPIPDLPEPELSVLRNHLSQAGSSLSSSPQPVKSFESFFKQQQPAAASALHHQRRADLLDLISKSFNQLIYGNDVDSVDVAKRITSFSPPRTA